MKYAPVRRNLPASGKAPATKRARRSFSTGTFSTYSACPCGGWATFEEPVKLLGEKRGFIDLFWKGVLLVEQKSAGRDLGKAKTQALSYFPGLKDTDLPRYILLSDFRTFKLYDLDEDEQVTFALEDLPAHVGATLADLYDPDLMPPNHRMGATWRIPRKLRRA